MPGAIFTVKLLLHLWSVVEQVLARGMLLSASLDTANVNSAAFAIAFLTLHVVAVADLLSIWGVRQQLQLCLWKERSLVGLGSLSFLSLLLALPPLDPGCP